MLTTFHGFDAVELIQEHGSGLYAELFERGDWFTVGTPYMKEKLLALGAPEDRMSVIPMPTDPTQFQFRTREPVQDRPVQLLTVARLTAFKGHEFGLKALSAVRDELPDFHYHIVGDGGLRAELEELVRSLDLDEHVTFHGAQSGHVVAEMFDEADVFLMPGIVTEEGRAEGQGVVFGEAQSSGIPILTTDAGGCPHAVSAGHSAIVVEHSNVEAFAGGLVELLTHQERWPEIGGNPSAGGDSRDAARLVRREKQRHSRNG